MSKRKVEKEKSPEDSSEESDSKESKEVEDEKEDEKEKKESKESSESSSSSEKPAPKKEVKKPAPKKRAPAKKKRPAKKKVKKDPNAPKKATTAYQYFQSEIRPKFKEKYEGISFGEMSQKISAEWKRLSDEEKKPYVEKHLEDKKRYEKEMKNYTAPKKASDSDSESSSEEESSDDKKKKKRKAPVKKPRDPDAPKNKTNAFMFFQKEQREKIKKENPNLKGVPDLAKKMGEIWRGMSEKEKQPYTDLAEKDKERYDREMEVYKKKQEDKDKKKK